MHTLRSGNATSLQKDPPMPNLKSALAFACLALAACQTTPPPSAALASALATIPQAELRDLLAELNNAHSQKQQLSFLMTLPLVGADAPFKEFFTSMAAQQAALEEQLRTWADQHHIDLTYHRGTDTMARAQKIMEDRQSKLIQSERRADRTRIALIQMYTDFDFCVGML